ncbi:MAG: phenylacetate--CoA ligase family protein, partial [Candidatus Sigynarchaeota archaeon]
MKQNIEIQKERLFNLVNHAINNVPYYQRIARERNIRITKETIYEDVRKFPVLTKDIIRQHWKELHAPLKLKKYIINTSGGTTGEPIKIIQDQKYSIESYAGTIVFDEFAGVHGGDKIVKLWGNEKEVQNATRGMGYFVERVFNNTYFQNSFKMGDNKIRQYVAELNKIRPKSIVAYVQSLYEMARFIDKRNLTVPPLHSVIVSAGTLTDDVRAFIERVFKCKVFNRYGSREVGLTASSCDKENQLHINMLQKYIEIVDDQYNVVQEHERGNIIVTNLLCYAMPLVRYMIGDRGALNFSPCSCGRGLARLENVFGRVVDVFKNRKGELIDGEYFTHLFYFRENVKKFQVVQEKIDEINIAIVTDNSKSLDHSVENDILEKVCLVMGQDCTVNLRYVDEIPPSSSGKM